MSDTRTIREEILELLRRGPMTSAELFEASAIVEQRKQLSNALYKLRVAGQIHKGDSGVWYLLGARAGAPAQEAEPAAEEEPAASETAPVVPAAAELGDSADEDPVRSALERSAEHARAALEEYMASINDPTLDVLLDAARSTRERLDAWAGGRR